jgi:hypothetical protein
MLMVALSLYCWQFPACGWGFGSLFTPFTAEIDTHTVDKAPSLTGNP